jgi:hypothetical protein
VIKRNWIPEHGFFGLFSTELGRQLSGSSRARISFGASTKTLVVGTCRILEWLGLVVPDSTLGFGCKPTDRLEEIVVKRGLCCLKNSKNVRASIEDKDVLNSILDAAVEFEDQHYVCPLASDVLHVLGLFRYAQDGDIIPTHELRQLAAERREGDRTKRLVKSIEAGEWRPK